MKPKKQVKPAKPTRAKMLAHLVQHAADSAAQRLITSDPNFGSALRHLSGERSRHMELPHFLEVDKFEASVARIIGDDRRTAKVLEGQVAEAVCQSLAAHFALPLESMSARSRFMVGSEANGPPHFTLTLRWRSH